MFTQCPQCRTLFPITVTTLCVSRGHVRCGCCGAVFSALDALSDEAPADDEIQPVLFSDRPPTLRDPDADVSIGDPDLFLSPVDPDSLRPDRPEFLEDIEPDPPSAPPPPRSHGRLWAAGAVLLALSLGVQIAWAERDAWLANDWIRPWLDRICEPVGCPLPPRRDLDRIRLVSRNIRPHPSVEDALLINATLRNDADFPQPFPKVEIRLSNLEGEPIASRVFPPALYLEEGRNTESKLSPGTLLPLVFEVVDPGDEAVAFEFVFR